MNKYVLCIFGVILLFVLVYLIYRLTSHEKYTRMRDIGYFPISYQPHVKAPSVMKSKNKYDGHRYRQKRRRNFLGQRGSGL